MTTRTELRIDGMHCEACVRRVRAALEKLPGLSAVEVNLGAAGFHLGAEARIELAEQAVEKLGFAIRRE